MSMKEMLAGLGGLLILGVLVLVSISVGAVFIFGAAWASAKLLPWFSVLTWVSLGVVASSSSHWPFPDRRGALQASLCLSRPTFLGQLCGWRVSC